MSAQTNTDEFTPDQLKSALEKYKAIFEYAPDPYYLMDDKGTFLDGNIATEAITGYRRDELIGKNFVNSGLLDASDIKTALADQIKNLQGNSTQQQYHVHKKDGSRVWIEIYDYPLTIEGKLIILGIARDITSRKKQMDDLDNNMKKYQSYLDNAVDSIVILDSFGKIIQTNKKVAQLLGYNTDVFINTHLNDLNILTLKSKAKILLNFAQRKLGKTIPPYDVDFVTKDGTIIPVEINASVIKDEKGSITGEMIILRDIRERKKTEQYLKFKYELANSLSQASNFKEILQKILDFITQIGEIDSGGIYEYDQKSGNFNLLAFKNVSDDFIQRLQILPSDTPTAKMTLQNKPIYADFNTIAKNSPELEKEGLHASALIPISLNNKVIASINIGSHKQNTISELTRGILQSIASDIGTIISRWKIERELFQEQQKAQTYLDNAQIIMIALDKDGIINMINKSGCRILGFSENELKGKNWFDICIPTAIKEELKKRHTQNFTGSNASFEYFENPILTKEGKEKLIAWHNALLKDEKGNVTGTFSSGEDITEKKKTECAQKQEQDLNNTIIDSIPGAFYILDPQGKYFRWNTLQRDLIAGKTDSEMPAVHAADTIHPQDRQHVHDAIISVIKDGKNETVEGRVLLHGGPNFIWMLMTGKRIIINNDPYLVGIGIDITQRKNAEDAKKKSQIMLQKIIDLLPIRIFWKDSNLNYLGCNKIFAQDAGASSPEDLIGKDDYQMGWKDQADMYRNDDKKVIDTNTPKVNFEEVQTTPQGNQIWLNTNKIPLVDENGQIQGVLGTYMDITKRKSDEEALKKHMKDLEILNQSMIGRENRMIELKKEIEELRKQMDTK
jgi:PAS domain S-box-containing protein